MLLARHIGVLILFCSALAWMYPPLFAWTVPHTSLFLAVIMFGMGLSISPENFRAVWQRPGALAAGCAAQFCVMPLLAWGLAELFPWSRNWPSGLFLWAVRRAERRATSSRILRAAT